MNIKKFLPLIAAAGLGLIALIIAHSGFGHGGNKAADTTIRVIVAKEAVAPGQQLTIDNLVEQPIAGTTVPPMAHTNLNDLVGRVTVAPMVPGQPVLDSFLSAPGALPGLPALVPPGMRAVTIDVTETTGVAGMIAPGSHVDIVSVLNQGDKEKVTARTVCSNVDVVAVGQRLSANRDPSDNSLARTVTLLAKAREAELIALACTSANTRLMLRGNGDEGPADSRGVLFADLLGNPMTTKMPSNTVVDAGATPSPITSKAQPAAVASTAPVSHIRHVQLIEGDKVSSVSFEMPDAPNSAPSDQDDYTNTDTDPVIPNQK